MCLDLTSPGTKVAKNNIICYKFGTISKNRFQTSYQRFSYCKGYKQPYVHIQPKQVYGTMYEVSEGYHTFDNPNSMHYIKSSESIGIFIIPKGATYAEGTFNTFDSKASSSLIYFGKNTFLNRLKARVKYGII